MAELKADLIKLIKKLHKKRREEMDAKKKYDLKIKIEELEKLYESL